MHFRQETSDRGFLVIGPCSIHPLAQRDHSWKIDGIRKLEFAQVILLELVSLPSSEARALPNVLGASDFLNPSCRIGRPI